MTKSTIDPATACAFRAPGLDYHAALEIGQRNHQTVEHVQKSHAANVFIQSGATPAAAKLNAEKTRLQIALQKVEADQAEQSALIQAWDGLLFTRDDLKRRTQNTEAELSQITDEIDGRTRFVHDTCVGMPDAIHGGIGRYGNLMQIVAGLKLAKAEIESVLPELREAYAKQLEAITAFAKIHGIDARSN